MKKILTLTLLFTAIISFGQTTEFIFDWDTIKKNDKLPQKEALWMQDNLSGDEITEVVKLVSALSTPATAQMLVSYFYLDGSYSKSAIKPYIDSLTVRPPDGDAGVIRVAYLASRLKNTLVDIARGYIIYTFEFKGKSIEIPEFKDDIINENIDLSFDYEPAQVILDILSKPDVAYHEILPKLNLYQFDRLVKHRHASFYPIPLSKERFATCLEIAASTKPLDELYKYMNPIGLLYFTDIINNLSLYKQQIKNISDNERAIFRYINASIAPFLPPNAKFSRKVSFFYINNADGWASGDVIGMDMNYIKDSYENFLPLLTHETYHGGQNAVAIEDLTKRDDNIQAFVKVLTYLFKEGTATYVAPASKKSKLEREADIKKGIELLEEIYSNTIVNYNADKSIQLRNIGLRQAGPFYWVGAEMSRVIVKELGNEKIASVIPLGGIAFANAYLSAIEKSKTEKNMFSKAFVEYIHELSAS